MNTGTMRLAAKLAGFRVGQPVKPFAIAVDLHVDDPATAIERARQAGLITWLDGFILRDATYIVANGVPPEH